MSGRDWLEANNDYLAASLAWLRLRLQRLAGGVAGVNGDGTSDPQPAAASTALDGAAARRAASASSTPPPGLLFLAERLGLSDFERDTMLLCAAADLDPGVEALIAAVQGGAARAFPTFGLALRLFDDPTWDALSPHRPLRRARLVEINQPGATPLTAAALRADERIVNLLKGLNALDERVAALVTPFATAPRPTGGGDEDDRLAPSQREAVAAVFDRLRVGAAGAALPALTLTGSDARSKAAVAEAVCAKLDRALYRIGLDALPTAKEDLETFARLWQREAALLPIALYIDADELDGAVGEPARALQTLTSRQLGLVFTAVREPPAAAMLAVEVERPTPAEQREVWESALAEHAGGDDLAEAAKRLAGQFSLNLDDIRRAAGLSRADDGSSEQPVDRAWDACRALTQPRLDALAQRVIPKATWDDLVLSDEAGAQLRQIAGQVRGRYRVYEDWGYARRMTRGLGISALFAGESGVGKTMAAEVLANELRLHLYRIDLSAVVSKYIGETEKNLRRLFDAAEQGGAILLFDEADALFGKRSEVKESHDRYANIEINYLLQRMEAFAGLAILATNMKGALDGAFMRRLRFVVNFPFPGLAERRRIWHQALPPGVPREGLDYDRLARFNLSGGNIHSVALNAAFLAAQRAVPVTAPLVLTALRAEMRKLDKPINEAEFR